MGDDVCLETKAPCNLWQLAVTSELLCIIALVSAKPSHQVVVTAAIPDHQRAS